MKLTQEHKDAIEASIGPQAYAEACRRAAAEADKQGLPQLAADWDAAADQAEALAGGEQKSSRKSGTKR